MRSSYAGFGIVVVIFGATCAFNAAVFASGSFGNTMEDTLAPCSNTSKMMYDFRKITSLENWQESSDTVRVPGMSKGAFVLQSTQMFQRAVFFSMLNPQPNGAAFVGFFTYDKWNLTGFSGVEMHVRGQGDNSHYKFMFKHNEEKINDGTPSYQAFFKIPLKQWTTVKINFDTFKAYYRGHLVPDAEPLNLQDITLVGIQIVGGVYSEFKQDGASSLEIDYIKSV